jgi:hypothetical protein
MRIDHINIAAPMTLLDQLGVEYSVNHIPDFNISQVFCQDPCGNGVEANFSGEAPKVSS